MSRDSLIPFYNMFGPNPTEELGLEYGPGKGVEVCILVLYPCPKRFCEKEASIVRAVSPMERSQKPLLM